MKAVEVVKVLGGDETRHKKNFNKSLTLISNKNTLARNSSVVGNVILVFNILYHRKLDCNSCIL